MEKNETIKIEVVAGVVIKKDGKYLLLQEKQPKAYGLWNFPAGRVDVGETIEQAAIRETKEESGYDVELVRQIKIFHGKATDVVKHVFEANIIGGELKFPEDEMLDARWFTFDEIKEMKDKLRSDWIIESISILENKKIMVSCRGVIVDGDKMLLVENRKNENNFYCTAGGRMEFGENSRQTVEREVYEELGVSPQIGRLLYINTFNDGRTQAVDFLYEILNSADYKDIEKLKGTHSSELSKIVWLDRSSDAKVLPKEMWQDFKNNDLPKDKERYING